MATVKKLMSKLIYIIFGTSIVGVVASQTKTIEGDTTNYSATEIVIAGLIVLLFLLSLVYNIAQDFM